MNPGNNSAYNPPSWLPQKDGFQPVNQSDEEVSISFNNGSHVQPNHDSERGIMLVHWVIKIVSILFCGLMLATAIIGVGKSFRFAVNIHILTYLIIIYRIYR